MKITAIRASWLRVPIPESKASTSDFGRNVSFNTTLVRVETDEGLIGYGEAKATVGSLGNQRPLVAIIEEELEKLRVAEEAGVDYVSVTIGWHESSQSVITRDVPMGHWLPIAEQIRKAVGIPVMMAFRQFLPSIPENAISKSQIDFWEMCRPMIADPQLPLKAMEGREDEIIPCIA